MKLATCITSLLMLITLAGCNTHSATAAGTDPDTLAVTDILSAGAGGAANTTFERTDTIVVSYDVRNITAVRDEGKRYFWLRRDLTVRDAAGNIVLIEPGSLEGQKPLSEKPLKFKDEISLTGITGMKPGTYVISVLVTDLIGFHTARGSITVRVG